MSKLLFVILTFLCMNTFAAETAITVQDISETALTANASNADSTNGNSFANPSGVVMLFLQNAHASESATVTITAQDTSVTVPGFGPLTKANLAVVLAAGDRKIVGPFLKGSWNDVSDNVVMTITAAGLVGITPFKVSQSLR